MSGECGYGQVGPGKVKGSEEVAKSASATLDKLNWLMKQVSDWRYERLELESNVRRLKSALKDAGKSPDEALRPDPLVVDQREEINRLELTRDRLEDQIRGLRASLLEADQAITCSGAKRLKAKLSKMREEAANERTKLKDEIGYLKLRVQEAEDDSSCSGLNRLRKKLREILNGDKKMERIIADAASRSCGTLIDLSNELMRINETLDHLRLENIRVNRENKRLKSALESAPNGDMVSGSSEHLEIIERVGELENALNEKRKEAEDQETTITSLRNEILGAKTAFKIKSQELSGLQEAKRDVEVLKEELKARDERLADLQERLEIANSMNREIPSVKNELKRVKAELLNVEIERDGLFEDIEKLKSIVSDRNDQIVKILTDNEDREKAMRSEIEGVRTKLSVVSAEKKLLKSRCGDLEEELTSVLSKSIETSEEEASGDVGCSTSALLVLKIKELEEELVELKRLSHSGVKKDFTDASTEVQSFLDEVTALKKWKARLEEELLNAKTRIKDLGSELAAEKSARQAQLKEYKDFEKRYDVLKSEKQELESDVEQLVSRFDEQLNELKIENTALKREIHELRDKKYLEEVEKQIVKDEYNDFEEKILELETSNAAYKAEIDEMSLEKNLLNNDLKDLKADLEKLTETKVKLEENLIDSERSNEEKLKRVGEELEEALRGMNSLKLTTVAKAAYDILQADNQWLKNSLKETTREKTGLIADLEKLRLEVQEATKFKRVSKTEKTVVMDCGDYLRADKELKYYIHLQNLAVKRVVDFINYVDGETTVKPAMASFVEPTTTSFLVLNLDENLTATFKMSQKLSETIFEAETNVQRLETVRNERNGLIAERERLKKIIAAAGCLENGFLKPPKVPALDYNHGEKMPGIRLFNSGHHHQLAKDDPEEEVDEELLAINHRMSVLHEEIKWKQHEATERLIEMRETMRQERIRLMEIADGANAPRSESTWSHTN